jgi:hypothetical protein
MAHRLVSGDGPQCLLNESEPQAVRQLFHESVILLKNIIQVWRWPAPALPLQFATRQG